MLTQLKITVRKKESWKRTLILKRVTRFHIIFLDCSTISNNSENAIFIGRTTRPRSTPQPLATTSKSFSHRTQWTITRNKLISEGKIYFDGNLTCNMTLVYCAVLVGCRTSKLPSPPCPLKKKGNTEYIFCTIREGRKRGKSCKLFGKDSSPPSIVWQELWP